MENPVMIPSSGDKLLQGADFRIANRLPQVRNNREAFDIAYGSRQEWYRDKRYTINDVNAEKMEKFLLTDFESAIHSQLKLGDPLKKFTHVEDYSLNQKGNIEMPNAPMVHK